MFAVQLRRLLPGIVPKSIHRFSIAKFARQVARTGEQYKALKSREIEQPTDPKLLRVAIIGRSNAGKSTLTNEIVHWSVSAVSQKVHTTNKNVIAVLSEGDTQIEFIDTPGLVRIDKIKEHKLGQSFIEDPKNALVSVDVIVVVTDISNKREQFHINKGILNLLSDNRDKESILVLNKVDKIKHKKDLIDFTAALTSGICDGKKIAKEDHSQRRAKIERGSYEEIFKQTEKRLRTGDNDKLEIIEDGIGWPNFSRVFMVSALENDGVGTVREYLLSRAQRRPWLYHKDEVTTLPPKELIINALRQVCLEILYQEIPYNIVFEIVRWELDEVDNLHIVADLRVKDRFMSLVIGPRGSNISTIVRQSRVALCNIFHCDVSLKLAVKGLKEKEAEKVYLDDDQQSA